jgi:hypothetical protein
MVSITGDRAVQRRLAEIAELLGGGGGVRVGFLENATYPGGKPVAMIAAIQEFGAPAAGIPPRPFFRNMIADKSPEWGSAIGQLMVSQNYDVERVLSMAGEAIAGQLRQSIVDTNSPPLAESTIARKGHSKPLIDTGHMLQSVSYEVRT